MIQITLPDGTVKGFQKGRRVRLTTNDVEILKREYKEIKFIAPRSQTNSAFNI